MNRDIFIQKARQAAKTSRILFEIEDYDGVCNRSYYSMFNSARVMLDLFGFAPRTHKGVIQKFRDILVEGGHVNPDLARLFARSEYARNVADYEGALTTRATAEVTLAAADAMCDEAERLRRAFEARPAPESDLEARSEPPTP